MSIEEMQRELSESTRRIARLRAALVAAGVSVALVDAIEEGV